jgi:hypothetical protein
MVKKKNTRVIIEISNNYFITLGSVIVRVIARVIIRMKETKKTKKNKLLV